MNEITAQIETITPRKAKELLQFNTHNRRVKDARIARYEEAMRRGELQVNGEAIKIADDGTILDGQNSLMAVLMSCATIQCLVVRGLPRGAQETMDQGASRSLSDVLRLRGEKDTSNLASAIGALVRWEKYKPAAALKNNTAFPATFGEQLEWLEKHPEIRDILRHATNLARRIPLPNRTVTVLDYKLHEASQDYADYFFDGLVNGTNLDDGDPVLLLRNWMFRAYSAKNTSVDPAFSLGMCIKAWNLMVSGRTVKSLTFRMYGETAEKFPEILVPAQEIQEGAGR